MAWGRWRGDQCWEPAGLRRPGTSMAGCRLHRGAVERIAGCDGRRPPALATVFIST